MLKEFVKSIGRNTTLEKRKGKICTLDAGFNLVVCSFADFVVE
jgi:hypothetical protein